MKIIKTASYKKAQQNTPYFYTSIPVESIQNYHGKRIGLGQQDVEVHYLWNNGVPSIIKIIDLDSYENIINNVNRNIISELTERVRQNGPDDKGVINEVDEYDDI